MGIKYRCDECDYQANFKKSLTLHFKAKHLGTKYSVMNVIIKLMSNRILNCMLKRSTWESNTDVMNVNTRAAQRNV